MPLRTRSQGSLARIATRTKDNYRVERRYPVRQLRLQEREDVTTRSGMRAVLMRDSFLQSGFTDQIIREYAYQENRVRQESILSRDSALRRQRWGIPEPTPVYYRDGDRIPEAVTINYDREVTE